jgi:hypothetical protein
MKKNAIGILMIFMTIIGYGQNSRVSTGAYWDNNDRVLTFAENNRIKGYKNGNPQNGLHDGSYIVIEEENIPYLVILWDDKTWDKYLMLSHEFEYEGGNNHLIDHDYIYLYNSDGEPFFGPGTIPSQEMRTHRPWGETEWLSASSELNESGVIYSTTNLDERIGICWAESISGQGIGEKIVFEVKKNRTNVSFNELYISIGFVSFEKPYLYKQNSRPKKIRISYEGEYAKIIELDDTPNLQRLGHIWWPTYSDSSRGKDLWLEILEVYPGTRYQDTCINFLCWEFWQ